MENDEMSSHCLHCGAALRSTRVEPQSKAKPDLHGDLSALETDLPLSTVTKSFPSTYPRTAGSAFAVCLRIIGVFGLLTLITWFFRWNKIDWGVIASLSCSFIWPPLPRSLAEVRWDSGLNQAVHLGTCSTHALTFSSVE